MFLFAPHKVHAIDDVQTKLLVYVLIMTIAINYSYKRYGAHRVVKKLFSI